MDKLKMEKPAHLDGIHPRVLQEVKFEFINPWQKCNVSLKSALIPKDKKVANVTLIY